MDVILLQKVLKSHYYYIITKQKPGNGMRKREILSNQELLVIKVKQDQITKESGDVTEENYLREERGRDMLPEPGLDILLSSRFFKWNLEE